MLYLFRHTFYVSAIGYWNSLIIIYGCTEWVIFNAPVFIHFTHEEFPFNCPGDELITKWYLLFSSSFSLYLYLSNMESSKTLGCSYNIKGMGHEGGDISLSWFNDNNTHDRKWPDIKLLYFVYRVSPKRLPNVSILKSELSNV